MQDIQSELKEEMLNIGVPLGTHGCSKVIDIVVSIDLKESIDEVGPKYHEIVDKQVEVDSGSVEIID